MDNELKSDNSTLQYLHCVSTHPYDSNDYTYSYVPNFVSPHVNSDEQPDLNELVATMNHIFETNNYKKAISIEGNKIYNTSKAQTPHQETPYSSTHNRPLRRISTSTNNTRDLGGWACDGGYVKYGKLFRSGAITEADYKTLIEDLGIQYELDLRDSKIAIRTFNDEVMYTNLDGFEIVYSINRGFAVWRQILKIIFDCVRNNHPLIFHCGSGRGRTATVACIIEALLGVTQNNCDVDYELTCFSVFTGTDLDSIRTSKFWGGDDGFMAMINAKRGDTFRDKVINWVLSLGFTADEINEFRRDMIDGDPALIAN